VSGDEIRDHGGKAAGIVSKIEMPGGREARRFGKKPKV
jgi:hypothetical protein